jgi:hypothetical protein
VGKAIARVGLGFDTGAKRTEAMNDTNEFLRSLWAMNHLNVDLQTQVALKLDERDRRIRKLEAALKLGWKVAIGTSYDGACDCATCAPVREFLKTVEALTAAETKAQPGVPGGAGMPGQNFKIDEL